MFVPPAAINEGPPVTPRPSASVLLVRGGDPWEVLMMRRPGGADFAPGAYVFPGGTVHDGDRAFEDEIEAAAVREVFEEVGILLARRGRRFAGQTEADRLRSLLEGGATFGSALGGLDLTPAFDRLVMFARWVTPALLTRRFDTRFYLARVPPGQSVRPQADEVSDWLWVAPRDALERPNITLVYATRAILESVAEAPSVTALLSSARGLAEIPIVEPRIIKTDGGWEVVRGPAAVPER